ncbi:MAG TPA: hypothetical protein VJV79_20245 [Polyangiaceae bacterium]|nr:hypothetical protein [Polyangiaceae bacterium]
MRSVRGTIRVMAGTICAILGILTAAPSARSDPGTVLSWYAARGPQAKNNWLYGDDACVHGWEDCNRCAPTVEQQWADMGAGALSWRARSWHFGWDRSVAPSGLTPTTAWNPASIPGIIPLPNLFAEWSYHAQGFVRTNDAAVKYAMSHSDDRHGSLTFISSSYNIYAMHETFTAHPSGVFTLGKYVGMVDGTDVVHFFDVRRALESHAISYTMSAAVAGGPGVKDGNGGIAMAKLFHGGYLVIVGQGGISNPSQETYFYFTDGPLTAPNRLQWLGTAAYTGPAGAGQSENISMITECGTGQLYTVHIAGDDALDGKGWYRLSKVIWGETGPGLQTVAVKGVNQYDEYCHHRSAASASVRDNGYLDLYCHERAEDNGFLSGQGDDWEFREGLNYYN